MHSIKNQDRSSENFHDPMESIGFYTLEDARAAAVSLHTPLWRCELILTDVCNFTCPYCRGMEEGNKGHLTWDEAKFVIDMWAANGLRNLRLSGGEPTLWKGAYVDESGQKKHRGLIDLVAYAKNQGIQRIAISTNGSVSTAYYQKLVAAGVNDFSISLDACCAEVGDQMAGGVKGAWERVIQNIKVLSQLTYVTVGVVFTEDNVKDFHEVVRFASEDLGVDDIRILSSSQWNEVFREVRIDPKLQQAHPILNYRMQNYNAGRHVRGLHSTDNPTCPLMLDDMAILKGKHYPCIIYMREQGTPVGIVDINLEPAEAIKKIRRERENWIQTHNTHLDPICQKNCLDVCVDYNNRVRDLNPIGAQLESRLPLKKNQGLAQRQLQSIAVKVVKN